MPGHSLLENPCKPSTSVKIIIVFRFWTSKYFHNNLKPIDFLHLRIRNIDVFFIVDLRHWIMIRESSKRQNVHSTTSYFILCFWFLDSYYFWQRIIEKYSSRYFKCNETFIINRIFYLAESVVSESTFQGAWGKRVRQAAGHRMLCQRFKRSSSSIFLDSLFISVFLIFCGCQTFSHFTK